MSEEDSAEDASFCWLLNADGSATNAKSFAHERVSCAWERENV